jgi:Fur family ferric uptake transcriptional regulator
MNPVEILLQHNIKKTSPRVAIIQALQKGGIPLSEAEIKVEMGDLYDRITFYRSVKTLMEAGVLHRIVVDNTTVKYAMNHCEECHRHEPDHVHFFCKKCHALQCLNVTKIPTYDLPNGFMADEYEVIIKGLCINCN